MKNGLILLTAVAFAAVPAGAQVTSKNLIVAEDNTAVNQIRVYDAAGGIGAAPLQVLPTMGAGGVIDNAGAVATDGGSLLAAVNYGTATPASQTVAVFTRTGDQLQFSQLIQAAGQPVSVAFGNSHLYILSTTKLESHLITSGVVAAAADGSAVLAKGDGTAGHLAVHTSRVDTAELSGTIGTVPLNGSGAVIGPSSAYSVPMGVGTNTPIGMAAVGDTTYFNFAHSNEVGTLKASGIVNVISSLPEQAPCWLAAQGPFLFSGNSPSHSISVYLVSGTFIAQAIAEAADIVNQPQDIAAVPGLVALDAVGANSTISVYSADIQGNLTLISFFTITGNSTLSGVAIMQSGPPDLTVSKTHNGSFTQGQVGATYTITVSNIGNAPTAGEVAVEDLLPTGLTVTGMSGTGWTCTAGALTCSRADPLGVASSYPAITVTVNVAANAPASVSNMAMVSGGEETNFTNDLATDVTTVNPPAPAPTTTTVGIISPEPSTVSQAYSVAYTVTSGAGTPTGNVTVSDGTGATCMATVAAGSCSLTSTTSGTKTITVSYAGTASFAASSKTATHVVNAGGGGGGGGGVTPTHSYDLTKGLTDLQGGASLVSNGGTISGAGYTFPMNDGLSGPSTLLTNPGTYTIAMVVEFDKVNSYDGYVKVMDFKNLTADQGLYLNPSHHIYIDPYADSGSPAIASGAYHTIAVTRDASTNILRTYLDGVQYGADITDTGQVAAFLAGSPIQLLMDDTVTKGFESSSGVATSVQIWNTALTAAQVAAIGIPLPTHSYDLTMGLTDLKGGPSLVSNGGTISGAGYTFPMNDGLSGPSTLLTNPGTYTIAVAVEFDKVNSYDGYVKVMDFKNLTADQGLYLNPSHHIYVDPYADSGSPAIASGAYHTIIVTRDASTNILRTYLDGVQYGADITDTAQIAAFLAGSQIQLLMDDTVTKGFESSSGVATSVQIWNTALTPTQIGVLY